MKDIEARLKTKGIRPDDFRAVCSVLLSKGFLSRADGGDSTRLYDVAARCEAELSEYLAFAFPVVLLNTLRPPHFRLVPSHHRDLGLVEPDEDLEMRREVKQSVAQALAASLLALRMLYDEQLLEKKIDVSGRISVKLTELALFMNTTFGVGLPLTKTEQRALFMKLKKHGALDMRIEALGDEDAVIVIRPEILTLVLEQNVRAAQAAFEASSNDLPGDIAPAAAEAPNDSHSAQIITLERTERGSTSRP
ncbi:DUF4194 domain-containing protein [Bradyrhizobium sp. 170]|uniref:DUF4194 domain-containing protein n=1 Tax=Bradyrhizobium sp. 170 TaxID=2782641 RepID=UPI0020003988|nr:DUF4194 domain-containing protein [Bradyrhizobium sp. 170]UPK05916.1 DUF4194 domain-containing protein [Bradyrhizobium sp. 170]